MAARTSLLSLPVAHDPGNPLADPRTAVAAAREHIRTVALREDSPAGNSAAPAAAHPLQNRIGLELEAHLVDLREPARRPRWSDIERIVAALPALPSGSRVTVEPGGQLELSTPPATGVVASVAALRADRAVLGGALAELGFGTVPLGSDIARMPIRVNPADRYVAMETHFAALRCGRDGRTMMAGTAALQVNVDAGPAEHWGERFARIRDLGPVLVAISACSPLVAGRASGWRSMRQEAWYGIDARRGRETPARDPLEAWTDYALHAPLMLLRDGSRCRPMTHRIPVEQWLAGATPLDRRPTLDDLDYHLGTLFPPVRPRGYLEIRCLDAVPDRWWPALAAITAVLVDDPYAADRAAECCEPVRDRWPTAARDGLADAALHRAAVGCVEAAAERCPGELREDVERYLGLVARGRTPGNDIAERADATTPLTAFTEVARG
jgi:glutamate--cysteine ligase